MLAGHTRPFYNLYEFNTGDDDQRFMPGSYYFPFSVCYAACSYLGSPAFAWNMTVLFSLWLTLWFTWLLALRFTSNLAIAGLAAFIALLLPFRWINLFGGSPAGFAMAWPPLVWLGVDMAIRRRDCDGRVIGHVRCVIFTLPPPPPARQFLPSVAKSDIKCVYAIKVINRQKKGFSKLIGHAPHRAIFA